MSHLSTESYKGVRDFYPEDQFIQNYIFGVWRDTVESFGYTQYHASILEPTELYKVKSGEEIVNDQTYSFIDRGERDVTLRPEMTPTVARMVAAKKRELSFPLRWYSIPNLFRYERPQRGRLREHWQLNADLFGLAGIEAEVEIITMAYQIMKNFGISDDQFEIKINSRSLLSQQLTDQSIPASAHNQALKLIDRKKKISEEDFILEWQKISDKPFVLGTPDEKITSLLAKLSESGITNASYDPYVVRGFDYYTGIIFEIFDTSPENNRSVFGGGRYDELLSIFGGEPVPTVGFGMGDVTIRDVLETYELLPEYISTTDLYICPMSSDQFEGATILANDLRSDGITVAVDYTGKKIGDQFKKADKDGISFVLVIGEDELKTKNHKLKNSKTREETALTAQEIASFIKNTKGLK